MQSEAKPISRYSFIDITRGICVLSIVFIHTTFWSGKSYVPTYIQTISLLIDVPAFFFLSGMVSAVTNKDSIISGIFRFSTTFGLLAFLYDLAFLNLKFKNVFLALTLNEPNLYPFNVVGGSYWFIPVYVVVSISSAVILKKMEKIYIPLMIALFSYYPFYFFLGKEQPQLLILGVDINFILFYLFMYLFGYFVQKKIIHRDFKNHFSLALSAIGIFLWLMAYYKTGDSSIFILQLSKFPVKLPYASASLLSIGAIIYFYNDSLKIKWLEYIGKNAIFYYAGQGIGASIILILLKISKFDFGFWPLKLLLMFSINLVITVIVSEGLRYIYKFIDTLYTRIAIQNSDKAPSLD